MKDYLTAIVHVSISGTHRYQQPFTHTFGHLRVYSSLNPMFLYCGKTPDTPHAHMDSFSFWSECNCISDDSSTASYLVWHLLYFCKNITQEWFYISITKTKNNKKILFYSILANTKTHAVVILRLVASGFAPGLWDHVSDFCTDVCLVVCAAKAVKTNGKVEKLVTQDKTSNENWPL